MELADQKKKRRLLHLSKTGRRRLLVPTAFFLAVIYYEELFMKLFCFHSLSPAGAFFTLNFRRGRSGRSSHEINQTILL